ncbi:dopamine N-acetyltransferase-like isoform X2 [Bombyx mori]|nr:dopamine N-acetyltransferase-like [Bombyx mori]XP_037873016.1 dopamine N-acetyltransferase-like isoform X2 [Bombyx mori]XP_037873017.1 dopamine N-acetyltransferase-like isoform X2 [Bombyx mori]XP_037873018.1 dopamine N-acetyltransferase-like isoform X2 [Bombyx mori]AJS19086.1 arylalkylamine N-acetyltransferase 2 [Bombyx mori]
MSKETTFTVLPITANDEEEIMDLLKRTFFIDEPLNEAVGLYDSGSCLEVEEYCRDSLLKGLSFKAVEPKGKIIGTMINGICPLEDEDEENSLLNQALRCPNPKFQRILHILARREEGAKLAEKFPSDKVFVDIKVAATDPHWRRRGVMNELLRETENITKQRGIRILRMDTSSAYSAMSAERLGFNCIYKAAYKDIKLNGEPLIVPKEPHVNDAVYIKLLSGSDPGTLVHNKT